MNIFNSTIDNLESTLDILTLRHTIIAGNIANIDTPGYKAKELDFKEALQGAMMKTGISMKMSKGDHMPGMNVKGPALAYVKMQGGNALRNDGNNVNIDKEMVTLSQNNIMFDIASQMLSRRFDSLKYAISEGRRS